MKNVIFEQLHNQHSPKYDGIVAFSSDMTSQQVYHYYMTGLQVYHYNLTGLQVYHCNMMSLLIYHYDMMSL